jgi:hypothetical protein
MYKKLYVSSKSKVKTISINKAQGGGKKSKGDHKMVCLVGL